MQAKLVYWTLWPSNPCHSDQSLLCHWFRFPQLLLDALDCHAPQLAMASEKNRDASRREFDEQTDG